MEPLSLAATVIPLTLAAVSDPTYPPSPLFDTGSLSSEYMKNFYLVPWTRFQPYIIGLILGSVFYRLKGQNKTSLELSGVVAAWLWLGATVLGLAVAYGLVSYQTNFAEPNISVAASVCYNGLHRLAWSLALSWLIIACTKVTTGSWDKHQQR